MKHTPFNGDHYIGEEIRKLIAQFKVQSIIETGMWSGHTTREFRTMVTGPVITIDVTTEHLTEEFGPLGPSELAAQGIMVLLGNSKDMLARALRMIHAQEHPILFYLDAHGVGNPILDELEAIAMEWRCRNRCVIVIHDFQVPGKDFGYNWVDYGRGAEPLGYQIIEKHLPAIFPGGHEHHYNERAEGAQRGVVFIGAEMS